MPILQLAQDAQNVEQALDLWRVISKCTSSLQDGQRLENIAWRLSFHNNQLAAPWPPTPESDDGPTTSTTMRTTSNPTPTPRPAGRIICELVQPPRSKQAEGKVHGHGQGYLTPASSHSSSDSERPSTIPRVVVLTPTPNLTPHPTPPATPLLSGVPSPMPPMVMPLALLPRSATRGMGSPVFHQPYPFPTAAPLPTPFAPQSTHILPLGGRVLPPPAPTASASNHPAPRTATGRFFLHAASHSSRSSSCTSNNSTTFNSNSASASHSHSHGHISASASSHSTSSHSTSSGSGSGSGSEGIVLVHSAERGADIDIVDDSAPVLDPALQIDDRGAVGLRGRGRGRAIPTGHPHGQVQAQNNHAEETRKNHAEEPGGAAYQPAEAISNDAAETNDSSAVKDGDATELAQEQDLKKEGLETKPKRAASAPFLGGLLGVPQPPPGSTVNGPTATINGISTTAAAKPAPGPNSNTHTRPGHARRKSSDSYMDAGDARSVSSFATSSSRVARRKQVRPATRSRQSNSNSQSHSRTRTRSRTRKGGVAALTPSGPAQANGHAPPNGRAPAPQQATANAPRTARDAPNALGLPSNLAAAAALVERTMSTRNLRPVVVLATSDEDGEWSDDEEEEEDESGDESFVDGESVADTNGGARPVVADEDEDEEEDNEDDGEEWEDESESPGQSRRGSDAHAHAYPHNAKAPPPSLQQHAPAPLTHGHARGHSTSGAATRTTSTTDLRQLPTRPSHRSTSHLPALAAAAAANAAHPAPPRAHRHHTTGAQNARTHNALQATMSDTKLSTVMAEAQRQRDMFAKAPRGSYENVTAAAGTRPGGLTLLLRPPPPPEPAHDAAVPQRTRPAGGFGRMGLMMTRPPVSAGVDGSELSPIPPTPATGAVGQQQAQQQQARLQQQQQQQAPVPPAAALAQATQRAPPPPRRPGLPRALSSSALPPYFGSAGTSGSLGKSSVAGPVVTGAETQGAPGSGSVQQQRPPVNGSVNGSANGNGSAGGRAAYRPKGPPAEMEYDDEEDESDADGRGVIANADAKGKARAPRDEGLQLSKSVAQEKLRVLAEKSAILSRAKNGGGGGDSVEAERRRLYVEAGVAPWAAAGADAPAGPSTSTGYATHAPPPPPNRSLSSAPVGFPYNLPAPAPPSTPRTTRQQMLRNEMSESLRHNLLWQRKLSRTDFIGPPPRRTKSTVNVMSTTEGRQPERSLVRVTPRAPGTAPPEGAPPPMVDPPGAPKKKLVRNLSWANNSEYHTSGW